MGRRLPVASSVALATVSAATAVVIGWSGPAAADGPTCVDFVCTVTFEPTGTVQHFTVPADALTMTMTLSGGSGGSWTGAAPADSASGGLGGRVSGTVDFAAGTYSIIVGGAGADADSANGPLAGAAGGLGGGGSGGTGGAGSHGGPGGGGGSFLFGQSGSLLIAAGGGGGAGQDGSGLRAGYPGGAGASAPAGGGSVVDSSGGPGTQLAVGAGRFSADGCGKTSADGTKTIGPNNVGHGGTGGTCVFPNFSNFFGGGGGGGGYFGGGGGAEGPAVGSDDPGAGGGGSGYVDPVHMSLKSAGAGVNDGDGSVVLVYSTMRTQVLTLNAPSSAVFATSFTASATSDSGLPVTVVGSGGCSGPDISGGSIQMTSGTQACLLTAHQTGDDTHKPATATKTVQALRALQPIDLTLPSSQVEVGTTFGIGWTEAGGNPVTFSVSGGCTLGPPVNQIPQITATAPPSCTVNASAPGSEDYLPVVDSKTIKVVAKGGGLGGEEPTPPVSTPPATTPPATSPPSSTPGGAATDPLANTGSPARTMTWLGLSLFGAGVGFLYVGWPVRARRRR